MADPQRGDRFEIRIYDEWWIRFKPTAPVILSYVQTVGGRDHRFRIVAGDILDTETGMHLSDLSVFSSSGGPGIDHLSGVKVSGHGFGLGRALLLREGRTLPPHLG
ncbi:hypothetical protein [Brevundimonas sp.]|uniref:hypothetical protein n=1 Tax=Brevundimonas sp. TaxID=1871086 RepID=UPI0025C2FB1D|nr:hypothetical protein [Brevundimonas sp.]